MRLRRPVPDAMIALGLFCVGLVLYFSGLYPLGHDSTNTPLGIRVGLLAAICAAGLLRRSHPPVALIAGTALFAVDLWLGPSVPVWIVLADLLYAAVLHGSARFSRHVTYGTGISLAALAGVVLVVTEDVKFVAGVVVVSALFFGTSLWWGLAIRRQVEITAMERERSLARQALERNTMARDLHDVIAGHLSAIAIHSEVALSEVADVDRLLPILGAIRASSTAALTEMRSMIEVLQAADPVPTGDPRTAPRRIVDLTTMVDAVRAAGSSVTSYIDPELSTLPTVVDHTVYRIAHEALTNAIKHAPHRPIDLSISRAGDVVVLDVVNTVADDAKSGAADGHGLTNMRYRAQLLGGSLQADAQGTDWVVSARLPVREDAS